MFKLHDSLQRLSKGFKRLFEARPPSREEIQKAYDIFGLKPGDDLSELDKLWKALARKNHPDLGGDPEKMKDINAAKDILANYGSGFSGQGSSSYSRSKVDWEAIDKRNEENGKVNQGMLKKVLDLLEKSKTEYDAYFKKFFPDLKPTEFSLSKQKLKDQGVYGASAVWSWENEDSTTALRFRVNVSRQDQQGLGSGSGDDAFAVTIDTELYNKGRKYKIGRRDWGGTKLSNDLVDPKTIFPEKALKKVSTQSRGASKMMARDFKAALTNELNGWTTGNDVWYLPIDEMNALQLRRTVMMRVGSWALYGILQKNPSGYYTKDVKANFGFKHMFENEKTLEIIKSIMKLLKDGKQSEAEKLAKSYKYEDNV